MRTAVDLCLASPLPMFVWWGPQLINIYNDAYAPVLGKRHPTALGQPARDIWADIWPAIGEDVDSVIRNGVPILKERVRFVMDRNGYPEETFFTYAHSPIPLEDGTIGGLFQVCTDETARVLAEQERDRLAEQRQRVERQSRTILESITDAFFAVDQQWRFTYLNPQAERLLNRTSDELLGTVIWEQYPGLVGSDFERVYRRAANERNASTVTAYYPEHERWYEVHGYPAADGIAVYFRNVTDRVQADEALRESQERFRAAFDQSIVGIVLCDLEGRILQANSAFCALVGREHAELIGRDSKGYSHPEDVSRNVDILARLRTRSINAHVYEKRYVRPEGSIVHAQISASSTHDASGRSNGLIAIVEEITSRKRAEQEHARLLAAEHEARVEAESLAEASRILSGELDLQSLVQKVTDATTALTRAQFGAFFYNVVNAAGESYSLYTLSGVPREKFASFPMPRMTDIFGPTFRGEAIVRSGDITKDARYGRNRPYNGMPQGHLPVRSYLAVPVISRSGEVLGGLFFGHSDVGVFTERDERLVSSIAAQTAVAMDNARLYDAVRASNAVAERNLGQLKAVVGSMAEGVVLADPQGNLIDWNAAALQMHGYDSIDQVRRHLASFAQTMMIRNVDGSALDLPDWPMSRVLRGETFTACELHLRRIDLDREWIISYSGTPVRDADGKIMLGVLTLHDVTAERRTQVALKQSEEQFRELADAMPQMVWVTRPDGHHEYYNRRWYEFTGAPEGATDGEAWNGILHPEDRERAWGVWRHSLATGEPYEIEYRLRHSTGDYRWTLGRALPIRDGSGAIKRWFGTCTDIDTLKRLQQERESVLERERDASRMKDEFLATLSHELRTPLSAILGWSQILRRGNVKPGTLDEGIAIIERNARAQTQIIEDLLDMSRIVSGKISLSLQRINLSAAVQAAIETTRPAASAKDVEIVFDGPSAARQPVLGDLNRLQQVFWNLLSNAVKFTPRGGIIQVRIEQRDSLWQVNVIDSGEGISHDFLPYVFDRFRQADASTTRKHGGLGLGLAIVKQLVELHGGKVRVRSEGVGKGATFTVALPVSAVHAEDLSDRKGLTSSVGEAAGGSESANAREALFWDHSLCDGVRGAKVLVVDDESDARTLLKRLFDDCDCTVLLAESADEAFALLQAERPDLLVSDISMPGQDGYELMRRVRALDPDNGGSTPSIALTAYARAEDRMKAVRAGFQMHVPKPVEPAELMTMVASLLGSVRQA